MADLVCVVLIGSCLSLMAKPNKLLDARGGSPSRTVVTMNDFYCDEVLSGDTLVKKVFETADVLAFHHTRPFYPVHVVVIPKRHINSLLALGEEDNNLLLELIKIVRQVAAQVVEEQGACRVITNLGHYQESKHLHWHVTSGRPLSVSEPGGSIPSPFGKGLG